jgi:hypothetical protein
VAPLFKEYAGILLSLARYPFGDHEIVYWRDRPGELGRAWSGLISITPHTWINFQNPGNPLPYPDPRTGLEPIRLTALWRPPKR